MRNKNGTAGEEVVGGWKLDVGSYWLFKLFEDLDMGTVKKFEDLEIWQLAREQAKDIFNLTCAADLVKDFELKDQIRRSSGSVIDNIAEGFERFSTKEFAQSLIIAKGSNGEVRSQLYRAYDRRYIDEKTLNQKLRRSILLGNKVSAFINYLQRTPYKGKRIASEAAQPPTSNIQPPTTE